MKEERFLMGTRIPKSMHEKLRKMAFKRRISINKLVVEILEKGMQDKK